MGESGLITHVNSFALMTFCKIKEVNYKTIENIFIHSDFLEIEKSPFKPSYVLVLTQFELKEESKVSIIFEIASFKAIKSCK